MRAIIVKLPVSVVQNHPYVNFGKNKGLEVARATLFLFQDNAHESSFCQYVRNSKVLRDARASFIVCIVWAIESPN